MTIARLGKPIFAVLYLMLLFSVAAFSQVSTGTLTGRATDSSGALVPGVEVTITSPAMIGGARSAITDEQGTYRFTLLAIGTYRVTFAVQGFRTLNIEGVEIEAGTARTVNGTMEVSALSDEVTVTSQAPTIDLQAATVGVNWDLQKFENIPFGRSMRSLTSLLPGLTVTSFDSGGSGMGVAGTGLTGNAYGYTGAGSSQYVTFDGMPQRCHYADMGSYEEIQVVAAAKGAEAPNPGAFVNLVLKTGSNAFHGTALANYEGGGFTSSNVTQDLLDRGYAPGSNKFTRYSDINVDFGGPVKKDKLWFYVAYRDEYSGYNLPGFISLKSGQPVVYSTELRDPTLKLTYQATAKMKLESMVQFGQKLLPYSGASRFVPAESTLNQHSWSLLGPTIKWTYIVNPKMTMDLSFNRWGFWFRMDPYSKDNRMMDLTTTETRGPISQAYTRPIRWSEVGSWSWFKSIFGKNNEIKAGFTNWWATELARTDGYPNQEVYRYRSLPGETNYFLHPNSVVVYDYPNYVTSGENYRAFYLNDQLTVNRKLTVNAGLRLDHTSSFLPRQGNEGIGPWSTRLIYPERRDFPVYSKVVPRLSFVYDLTGTGKFALKASYGEYSAAGPGGSNVNPASTTTWTYNNWDGSIPYIPVAANLNSVSGGNGDRTLDPNLKSALIKEYTAGVEMGLKHDYNLRVNFVRKQEGRGTKTLDLAQPYEAYTDFRSAVDPGRDNVAGTADDGVMYAWSVPASYPTFGKVITRVDQVRPGEGSNLYSSWEVTFNKAYSKQWSFLASYLTDFVKKFGNDPQNPNSLYYNFKNSAWDTTWKFSGQYDLPYGLKFSSGYLAQSGNHYGRSAQMLNARNATVTVMVEGRSGRYPYVKLWDNRVAKTFRIHEQQTLEGMFDLFNSLNSSAVTAQGNTNGPNYLKPTTIIAPRVFRLGVRWKF